MTNKYANQFNAFGISVAVIKHHRPKSTLGTKVKLFQFSFPLHSSSLREVKVGTLSRARRGSQGLMQRPSENEEWCLLSCSQDHQPMGWHHSQGAGPSHTIYHWWKYSIVKSDGVFSPLRFPLPQMTYLCHKTSQQKNCRLFKILSALIASSQLFLSASALAEVLVLICKAWGRDTMYSSWLVV